MHQSMIDTMCGVKSIQNHFFNHCYIFLFFRIFFKNKMVSKHRTAAIDTFERDRKNMKKQPLYVLHAFASRHKIRGRSTRDRAHLEHLIREWIRSFPSAKIACYQKTPPDCKKVKAIPTREGELLRYKILKEEGERLCPQKKYWICNLQELS